MLSEIDKKKLQFRLIVGASAVAVLIIGVIVYNLLTTDENFKCSIDNECVSEYGSNYYCSEDKCLALVGDFRNTCSADVDCTSRYGSNYYCSSGECISSEGLPPLRECSVSADCSSYGSNYYCSYGTCLLSNEPYPNCATDPSLCPDRSTGFFSNFLSGGFVSAQGAGNVIYYKGGWVGIGTSTPKQVLNVVGSFNVTGPTFFQNSICSAGQALSTSGIGELICVDVLTGGGTGGGSSQWTTSSGKNIYYNLGRIGIGTTNPEDKLDVRGGLIRVEGTTETVGLRIRRVGANPVDSFIYHPSTGKDLDFWVSGASRMKITSDGKLQVSGTVDAQGFTINGVPISGASGSSTTASNFYINTNSDANYRLKVASSNTLPLYPVALISQSTPAGSSYNYGLYSSHTGGATSPGQAISVYGLSSGSGTGTNIGGSFVASGSPVTNIGGYFSATGSFINQNYGLIVANGDVGIGATDPKVKLDVGSNKIRIRESFTPPNSPPSCFKGEIGYDTNYIYVCVSNNQWKKVALSNLQ